MGGRGEEEEEGGGGRGEEEGGGGGGREEEEEGGRRKGGEGRGEGGSITKVQFFAFYKESHHLSLFF